MKYIQALSPVSIYIYQIIATNWRIFHYIYMPTFSLPMFQLINLYAEGNVASVGSG